jgi:C1A family cysteine protease
MKRILPGILYTRNFLSIIFLISIFICYSSVLYGQNLQIAPLNPEFIKFQSGVDKAQQQSIGGHGLGLVPEPILPHFSETSLKGLKATLPAKYDLRTAGAGGTSLVTSVKDQGSCGACWTFSIMANIEAYAKKFGLGDYDLSENNLKECNGFLFSSCAGGNTSMSSAYLARKSGPISEINDPYNENETSCKGYLHPEFWVSDLRFIPRNNDIIKQAILDYGALATNYFADDASYNSSNYTYYNSTATTTNHAVLLVGWDDNKVTAGGTGAWIIKNSWGTSWGEAGFFYVSYNDVKINSSVTSTRNINAVVSNSTQFDYDQLGVTSAVGYSAETAYGLIRFSTGNKSYSLKKLSTFVQSSNATVRFEVYQNFDGTTLSNLLGTISDKACDLPGYYTFDLTTPIPVSANTDFYVKVYYNTIGYNYPVPIETIVSGYSSPVIETGRCWISNTGTSWSAIGADKTTKADLCIKAYGEYTSCTPPTTQATSFSATTLTENSMTVNWTRGNGSNVMVVARAGSAVNYDPDNETSYTANSDYGAGTQLGLGNFVVYNGTGSSVNMTSLIAGMKYYFSIYEYNSGSNCYMTPALTGNAVTAGLVSYCAAGSTTTTIGYISRVRLNTLDQISTLGTNGYSDFTPQVATMQIGVNAGITINRNIYYLKDTLSIWVDWNRDGDFSGAGEKVYTSTAPASSYSASFAPPVGAKIGTTRMRIRLDNNTRLPNSTPCGNSYYGEVEDYTINVILAYNQPLAPVANAANNISQTGFKANWSSANTASGYRLDVATNSSFTTFVSGYNDKDVGNVLTLNLTGLAAKTPYYYRVRAYNAGGTSVSSNSINVTTLTNPAPAPLSLIAASCNDIMSLKWRKSTGADVIRYRIYGGLSGAPSVKIDSTTNSALDTVKNISGLIRGKSYYFSITAVNYDGPESGLSTSVSETARRGVVPVAKAKWGDVLICPNVGDSIVNFQWLKNSVAIPGATTQNYVTGKQPGAYSVVITDRNGCINTSNVVTITGLKALSVFPNPTSGSFALKISDVTDGRADISIINSSGIRVKELRVDNLNDETLKAISVSNLIPGIYIVRVLLDNEALFYSKIVVTK